MQSVGYQDVDYGGAVTPTSPRRVQARVPGEGSWVSGDSAGGAGSGKITVHGADKQELIQMEAVTYETGDGVERMGRQGASQQSGSGAHFSPQSDSGPGCCGRILVFFSYIVVILTFPLTIWFCIKIVQEYERAIIFRLGRVLPTPKGPGIFFILPCTDSIEKVDLRTISFDVPPQEILTRDSVTVAVDAVVYYRISDPMMSVINILNCAYSTKLLAQTTLRNILGQKTLTEVLVDRESIAQSMQLILDEGTDPWGVKVERVEVKDVRLPQNLQRAMAAEAEATRDAKAKFVAAEGEQKASHALKQAADVISESACALQLRYLQTLNAISAEKNSTIIFPIPIDLVAKMGPGATKASAKM